jgi:hypothetical protein
MDGVSALHALDWKTFASIKDAAKERQKTINSFVAEPLITMWLLFLLSDGKKERIVEGLLKNIAESSTPCYRSHIVSYYSTTYHTDDAKYKPYEDSDGTGWGILEEYITFMNYHTVLCTLDTSVVKPAWWIYNHTDFRDRLAAAFDSKFFRVHRKSTEVVYEKNMFTTTKYDIYIEYCPNGV